MHLLSLTFIRALNHLSFDKATYLYKTMHCGLFDKAITLIKAYVSVCFTLTTNWSKVDQVITAMANADRCSERFT